LFSVKVRPGIESLELNGTDPFITEPEERLNQNGSPYRRMKFLSENHLIWNIENRVEITDDGILKNLILKYKESIKQKNQLNFCCLFEEEGMVIGREETNNTDTNEK
jgi:hypothetical protein